MEAKIKVDTGTEVKVSIEEIQKAFLVATKTLDLLAKIHRDENIENIEITWQRQRMHGVFYGTEGDYYTDFLITIKSSSYHADIPEYFIKNIKNLSAKIRWEHSSSEGIKRVVVVDNESDIFLGLFVLPDEEIETLALALLEGIRIKMLLNCHYLWNQHDFLIKESSKFLSITESKLKFTSHYGELDKILAP